MSDFFTEEDRDNIRTVLGHHLGYPWMHDDDGKALTRVSEEDFMALEHDLLRYCTRLRCQPQTDSHTDEQGNQVPAHKLIGDS